MFYRPEHERRPLLHQPQVLVPEGEVRGADGGLLVEGQGLGFDAEAALREEGGEQNDDRAARRTLAAAVAGGCVEGRRQASAQAGAGSRD